jgi:succinyl-CoA synthetase beta subunit
MKLLEYKAHELFSRYGLPCSDGFVVASPEELERLDRPVTYPVVLKAQVQTGGRGKAGGVQFAENKAELVEKGKQILGMTIKDLPVNKVFVTGKADIKKEMYLSFTLDRKQKKAVLIFSPEGGVDINDIAERFPDKVVKVVLHSQAELDDFVIDYAMDTSGLATEYREAFRDVVKRLYRVFIQEDCMLAEINPLIVDASDRIIALDGKIDVDDNALFRHDDVREFRDEIEENDLVLEARKFRFLYIPVKDAGNIAIVSNGSGMIMSSIDLITKRGMTVTCALDLGGGATADRIQEALRIVASNPRVDTIFINIFGGITRCDEIARGVEGAMANIGGVRLVIRLEGTNKEKGLEIIDGVSGNIRMADGLRESVEALAQEMGL